MRDKLRNYFVLLISMAFSAFATSEITISQDDFDESMSSSIKVSGEYLLGFQTGVSEPSRDLFIRLPEHAEGELCVKITSIDGLYKSRFSSDLDGSLSGSQRIIFPSGYLDELRRYENSELAVLSRIGENCEIEGQVLLSSWGVVDIEEPYAVNFFLRSDVRKDTVYVPSKSKDMHSFKCIKIREGSPVSYDRQCKVDDFESVDFTEGVEIYRKHMGPVKSEFFEFL